MRHMELSEAAFIEKLRTICQADTSAEPTGWTKDNPLWGHCAVVALLAQDTFGGSIMKGSLKDHPKYEYLISHYWNVLPDGRSVDFTAEQYPDLSFTELHPEPRTRQRILRHPDTVRRYMLLKERFD